MSSLSVVLVRRFTTEPRVLLRVHGDVDDDGDRRADRDSNRRRMPVDRDQNDRPNHRADQRASPDRDRDAQHASPRRQASVRIVQVRAAPRTGCHS